MGIESLFGFLNNSGIHTFYPLCFPSSSDASSMVEITGGTVRRGGVQKIYVRILTRETRPKNAMDKALEISDYIQSEMKGAFFDGLKVLHIDADNPSPLYLGEEDGLFTVSMNYTIIQG